MEEFQKGDERLLIFEVQVWTVDALQNRRPFDVWDDLVGGLQEDLNAPGDGFLVTGVVSGFIPIILKKNSKSKKKKKKKLKEKKMNLRKFFS